MGAKYLNEFEGLAITEKNHQNWPEFEKITFDAKVMGPNDVDIKIECCGVCGSDIHSTAGRWGKRYFPMVPGHEIVGVVVALGSSARRGLEIGQRVGAGAVCHSCRDCVRCEAGDTSYCFEWMNTYNEVYEDSYVSKGGFASHIRIHENHVYEIPEDIPSVIAAPLLCAGIAAFAPLHEYKIGKNSKVGVLGIGSVGAMGVIFAKYFGAEVIAFDKDNSKKKSIMGELKPDHFVSLKDDDSKRWSKEFGNKLDLLILATNSFKGVDFDDLVHIMKFRGKIVNTSEPPVDEEFPVKPYTLLGCSLEVGSIGSPDQVRAMYEIVSKNQLHFPIETMTLTEDNLAKAFERMDSCDVRFKITMVDYDKIFN